MSQSFTKGIPIDYDGTLSADSNLLVSSQRAVKTYVDNGLATKVSTTGNETIAGDKTFTGKTINTLTAVPSVGETIEEWKINDDPDSYLKVINGSDIDNVFIPTIRGYRHLAGGIGVSIIGTVPTSADTQSNAVINLRGQNENDSLLTAKNILAIQNYLTNLLRMDYSGNVEIGTAQPTVKLGVNGDLALKTTTPTQITADQNDYSVIGYTTLRLSTDASRNITGFANGFNGKLLIIHNIGSFNIVLNHLSASSVAANRMILGNAAASITILPNDSVTLQYDNSSLRWRLISKSF